MKNKLHYQIVKSILINIICYIVSAFILQIVLTYIFHYLSKLNGYFDFSFFVGKDKGFITLSYFDAVRIISIFVLLIPFVYMITRMIYRTVSSPLEQMKKQISAMNYEHMSERLYVPAQFELLELEQAFNELLIRLEKSDRQRHDLEEKNSLLISGMAHDLKTPISTLQGYTQALLDDVIESDEKKREYLQAINRKAVQMNELITILFDYVSLGAANFRLHIKRNNIVEVIKEEIAIYFTDFEERGIEFIFDLPECPVWMSIDRKQVSRVFSNLYSNALKYNKPGSCVHTVLYNQKDGIVVRVEDTGENIDKDLEQHIFDPFVMGDHSRKSGSGNGLGLCIAARIMGLHNGVLELDNHSSGGYKKAFILMFKSESVNQGQLTQISH